LYSTIFTRGYSLNEVVAKFYAYISIVAGSFEFIEGDKKEIFNIY